MINMKWNAYVIFRKYTKFFKIEQVDQVLMTISLDAKKNISTPGSRHLYVYLYSEQL